VQFAPGMAADFGELRALCEANLARYKVPAEFHAISEFPRNAMNKIVKPKLAALLA
jgi:acyl-coenzyme A synthetase/AMP-(fatty) acid ligase